jgi:hypothetical protein
MNIETAVLIEGHENGIRIIRTYSTEKRAQEDLELLQVAAPDRSFQIENVQHIDD